ncbi:zinc-dependent metalloprotease [Ideonella sp. A 288]|uniref:zinc-dependent metalloprotease n=1 Tax=Ideonella sp. A 288 TaxID=1962181 RepID=UPI001F2FB045|nr:zinc-dependent metalloprotease [Ideonella sp. A 288]
MPGQPPAFATVIKDAKKIDGLVTMYQKDEKVWLELTPADFDRRFFLSPKMASGIGENGLFGGMMAKPQVVKFRRLHNVVQMLAVNTGFEAKAGTPLARAIEASYSPSLLAATGVASAPHPERKSVLVDASPLFVNDMLAIGATLGRTYRQGYGLDGRNSAILNVRGKPDMVAIEVLSHYAVGALSVPGPGAPPGAPVPSAPDTLPDARSMFFKLHYSLARLPEQPMVPRRADPRVGHFAHIFSDFSDDLARTPRVRHIARWRLEKKDPSAALSEPVLPITYWIDRTVPLKYRDAITAGILEWNKAFEKIGFKDAVVVKVQPEDADFDTLDFGVASVRWMVNQSPQFGAIGPRHVDPRTGEIIDADIAFESLSSRNLRTARARILGSSTQGPAATAEWARLMQLGDAASAEVAGTSGPSGGPAAAHVHDPMACDHGDFAAEQLGYGLEVLAAQGELDPAGPEAEQFVQAYMKDVTMHEVGHTLGLRHNFRASRIYSDAQLSDPEFTRGNALTGSVMEYAPINLPRPGDARPAAFQTTLGAYDYWAIEYAYKPLAPADEAAELARLAARSAEPELAYGTDEDNFFGVDPDALQFDLGNDPIAFARKRFEIEQDLFKRQESRQAAPDQDWSSVRRVLNYALRDAGRAAGTMLRQIGGVRMLRDFPNTGRDPIEPVEGGRQRAALDLLARHVLAADSFVVSPALQRRLAPDFLERTDAVFAGAGVANEPPLAQNVHSLRQVVLGQLMSDTLASRMLDSAGLVASAADALSLAELYERVESEVWSELQGRGDIPAPRRELQREHVNRLSTLVLRPGALTRADARGLVRAQATGLLARLDKAQRRTDLGADSRRHLQDSADTLRSALAATLQRAGV